MEEAPRIVIAQELGLHIGSVSAIGDLMGECLGADGLLLTDAELGPDVFVLRTGILGELMQKLTNYRVRTAVVVPDPAAHGPRFQELALEHREHRLIRFFPTREGALAWLSG